VEEQNSSNARRRATGDGKGTSLKQSTFLHSFSPTLFKAAVYIDGQNLVDVMMIILNPKMLGFYFRNSRRRWQKSRAFPQEL